MPVRTNTLFQNYLMDYSNYEELLTEDLKIKPDWERLLNNLITIGSKELVSKQADIDWLLEENGVTYNVYNDPKGLSRPWNLNIVPFIIHQDEWNTIEKGVQQRSEILNLILKDIYGKRELFTKGIIPPEVIYAHRGFLRSCDQIRYNTSKQLLIHAADLARGPDGQMWVVNDRTQAPSGMGYALENRFSISRTVPEIFTDINVKQPSQFFKDLNGLLLNAASTNRDNPTIVILTPGPHNETYFEHSYLSSFLGLPLVKGNDLIVRYGKLWMKSLIGLKQVDVILRRVDDVFVDPLELREDSYLGIAGLMEVVRLQNVAIVNPVGSGILENPALIPFMSNICKYFLDEDLLLPQIASWWCGQEKERNYVLTHLPSLVIKKIDRPNRERIFFCEFLSKKELNDLKLEIMTNPFKFVAQERIHFSSAPNFTKGQLEPRNIVCRSFSIAKEDGYSVMPGGLVRVAAKREELMVSNQRGGTSKDFWIATNKPQHNIQHYSWQKSSLNESYGLEDVPSNTAENLFWSGRYLGRTIITARYMRMVMNQMNKVQYNDSESQSENLKILFKSVTNITSTFPGFVDDKDGKAMDNPLKEIESVIFDTSRSGSFAQTLSSFNNSFYSLRNLWSRDMWRVFESIQKVWTDYKALKEYTIAIHTKFFDRILTRLIAFMALIDESVLVKQGLLLYFIGLQMEQAMMTIAKFRSLVIVQYEEDLEYDILESLLSSHESLNIYRYSYRSYLSLENVLSLVLFDKEYTRSLAYQINRLQKDIEMLPVRNSDDLTECKKIIMEASLKIKHIEINELVSVDQKVKMRLNLEAMLSELSELLHATSLSISDTYFNHSYRQKQLVHQNITD